MPTSLFLKTYAPLFLSSWLMSFVGTYLFIFIARHFFQCRARLHTPHNHQKKNNIPTMGGISLIVCITVLILSQHGIINPATTIFLATLWTFSAIGAFDDWKKIQTHSGITTRKKWILQSLAATIITFAIIYFLPLKPLITIPFFNKLSFAIGPLFYIWISFIIIGTSNAVNLTDGLDGLALGSLIPAFFTLALGITWYVNPLTQTYELASVAIICAGACAGFLPHNIYPASLFMGDVGALGLGAGLGYLALATKQECILALAGIVFVIETLSVFIQVFCYKKYKTRFFLLAPIHHHFELKGYHERTITFMFTLITILGCTLALYLTNRLNHGNL